MSNQPTSLNPQSRPSSLEPQFPSPDSRLPTLDPQTRNSELGTRNSLPFISVVTPSFNQGRFIRRNIESVIEQGLDGVEHIVADGASTDETISILDEYPHLVWFSQKDRGQTEALNNAIARARGEWIVWINSDDYLLPGALAALREYIPTHPEAQFVYSNCLYVDESGAEIERIPATYTREGFDHWWRRGVGFVQPGAFFRRELWERHGPFDESFQYIMDYDFWRRFHADIEFHYLDGYLAAYRLHGASKTSQGQTNFAREMVLSCRRYWDRQGSWAKWKWRAMLFMALGRVMIYEGARIWEEGRRAEAIRLLAEGCARDPMGFLSHPNLCFLLRRIIPSSLYHGLRKPYRRLLGRQAILPDDAAESRDKSSIVNRKS
ncbi:MAG: glycosyltransferase family 2 protein [Candidatus Sumerlaeota bacterium]|nr:glycosyltransferase family 2 protein [Candidatus Sumerlaeota bacterium]